MIVNPTHCVSIVTYNQEKFIRKALESVFDNTILPNKVLIFDDCSTDNTWNVICEFKEKYNNIFEPHQNEKNIGIFKNINQMYQYSINSDCDIITFLAGDDYLKKGIFEELNKVVENNNIDVKNDKYIIVTNTEELYPDGSIKLIDNYQLRDKKDLIFYRLTSQLSYREVGISRNVLEGIELYKCNLGICEDLLITLNFETKCKKFYFTPFVSSCYRVGVGVSLNTENALVKKSRYDVEKIALKKYRLSRRSKSLLKKHIKIYEFYIEYEQYKKGYRKRFPIILFLQSNGFFEFIKRIILKFFIVLLLQ